MSERVTATTVGPVHPEVRDRLADYRDERGLPNYNRTLRELLDKAERDGTYEEG